MKKKLFVSILCFVLIIIVGSATLWNYHEKKNPTIKNFHNITLAEVAHTVFYAPLYVAIENGYFEEEGIQLNLILTSGADKVTAALLSGDADIGLCGSEATIYVYQGGEKDYLKTFSQLTQKDGTFLFSRNQYKNFSLEDLSGHSIIGGRVGGMPEMTLEYALKIHGIDPREDVLIDTSIDFASMSGAFIGGQGDFVTLFEPTASMLEEQGYGYVVASVGELAGVVPYTSFSARSSYLDDNSDLVIRFDHAIQKGLDFIHSHSDLEVAEVIQSQFPDSSLSLLEKSIMRYRKNDTWPISTFFLEESFNHLQDIMLDYGQITETVSYDELFYSFSRD